MHLKHTPHLKSINYTGKTDTTAHGINAIVLTVHIYHSIFLLTSFSSLFMLTISNNYTRQCLLFPIFLFLKIMPNQKNDLINR
jgi:hypothetical protein